MFIFMAIAMLVLWWVVHHLAILFVTEFGLLAGASACVVMYVASVLFERGRHW